MIVTVLLVGMMSPVVLHAQPAETDADTAAPPVVRVKTFLHPNGEKLTEGRMVDDVRDGQWMWWYDNGQEFASMTYDMGTPVGTERHLLLDGKVVSEGEYQDGAEWNGSFVDFDGELHVTAMRTYKEGTPTGKWQWWFTDGSPNIEGEFVDGEKNGTWTWWYPNGQKFADTSYENGNLVGRESHWSPEGEVRTTGEYRDGQPWAGTFVDFLGAEQIVTFQRSFQEGQAQGDWTWWYDDGSLNTQGSFAGGEKDGKWLWWYANGKKFAETDYAAGVSQGVLSYWSEEGELLAEGTYDEEGTEVNGTFVDFSSDLILTAQRSYVDGLKEGDWIEWYENGQQASASHYKNGQPTGTWMQWNEEGIKTSEERYVTD